MTNTDKPMLLYRRMMELGYPEEFTRQICKYLSTEWTATRMLGYLRHTDKMLPPEEIVDEMLAILSDRDRIMEKKQLEYVNSKWNAFLEQGRLGHEEEVDDR